MRVVWSRVIFSKAVEVVEQEHGRIGAVEIHAGLSRISVALSAFSGMGRWGNSVR
jgi:hypothetical protein